MDDRYNDRLDQRRGGPRRTYAPPPLPYPNPRPIDVVYVDFAKHKNVKSKYNNWIENATNGVIKSVDLEVDAQTEMILTSAIYFKGQWLFSFNSTEQNEFTLPNKEKIQVESMKIRKKYHAGRFDNIDAKWAAIPYNSTEALVIILPNEDKTVDEVIAQMDGSEMTEIIDDLAGYGKFRILLIIKSLILKLFQILKVPNKQLAQCYSS